MSLLNKNSTVDIPLYYQEKPTATGFTRIIVLEDEKGKSLLEKQEQDIKQGKKVEDDVSVHVLNTKWKTLSWKDQNEVTKKSMIYSQVEDRQDIDLFMFRDARLKTCLKSWDLKDEFNNVVPVSKEIIDELPADVVFALITKYDRITSLTPEEEKN